MNSIFISSSFKDMQHERDTIRYKTLPQINEYLRNNYGQETTIIDLRRGIIPLLPLLIAYTIK